ncbi:MAG: toprim domain-containing protein, partial [Polyangiales bacterium]
HRTWLAPAADGRWTKAPLERPKMVYGSHKGGTIRLWRGASRRPLGEAPPDDTIAVAEGIEDALTVALVCPEWRVLAAVSVGNLVELELPPAVKDVVLVCQRDGENRGVRRARERAVTRWHAEGRAPRLAWPPEGFKDFNDWLKAESHDTAAASGAT